MNHERIRNASKYVPAPKLPCRIKGCDREGAMRWCILHSPEGGIGLIKCRLCGEPVAEHKLTALCR